ncbi:flagellar FliL protein [Thermodesulfitimonas autotrophica]|uniref:Flagellar protein FliL n=1 Tax=Thermodesulfitimonas autotrophica TaxID=1894989 RepID=A0A3N5BB48_9THEO|nr:flagellar basal body-associated FliL family protein [Thermodesulfitimonas autotrophica]RPF42925.1 flagellar FliL protein [Thermodesulfitimonas autotrophica]
MAKKKAAPEGEGTHRKGGKKKLIIIIVVAVLILAAGAAAAKMFLFKKIPASPEQARAAKETKETKLETLQLDSIVVNLADQDASHYLRITLVLAFPGGEEVKKKLEEKKFAFRDRIIQLLRKKHYAEVIAPDYTEKLKKEILNALEQSEGGQLEISDLYITEYLVQ